MDATTTAVLERPGYFPTGGPDHADGGGDLSDREEPRFEDWVRERQDILLRSARRMTDNHADAQDLLQTALARTFPMWDGITDKRHADAYVRRVLVNTRTSLWRSRRLQEYAVATDELPERPIEDGTEHHAQRDLLQRAMERLSARQRHVVELRYYQDLSTPQTASALGVSTGTVKSTLHRALTLLREEIQRLGGDLSYGTAPGNLRAGIGNESGVQQNGSQEHHRQDTEHHQDERDHHPYDERNHDHRSAPVLNLATLPGQTHRAPVSERAA
ncbi:hypothetical protein BIV57_11685 [Mangrovactinospora gilvigrisea]|uniref:SigE family RNA polymerase sigma factor n=1 Tax=Mangrovactinospora gilvigrisea TaxID=1428644 RepID=A0A1J7BV02_9ACTN|nr:hypothetical protein BIV57_11685 [Mangrovactinospora gilvigrisea]